MELGESPRRALVRALLSAGREGRLVLASCDGPQSLGRYGLALRREDFAPVNPWYDADKIVRRQKLFYSANSGLSESFPLAIDQALSRLARDKIIRRLGRGLYYIPGVSPTLGIELAPDMDAIARAIGRKTGSRVVPSGAVAANWIGLSTQVPAKPVYLTDGKTRSVRAGNTVFFMKHVSPKNLPLGSPTSAMVFQALRYLGKEAIKREAFTIIRRRLSAGDRRRLLKDIRYVTGWIAEVMRKVCGDDGSSGKVRHG